MATPSRALKIAALYALFGVAWSVFSDRIILLFAPDASVFSHLEIWKGVVFVLLSAVMLFLAAGGLRRAAAPEAADAGAPGTTSLILVFAGLAAAIVLVGLVGVAHTADKQREKEIERLQSIADLKVRQISLWFGERLADARVVRNDTALTETYAGWQRTGDDALRLRLLERLRMHGATHDYPVVALVDERGDIIMQSDGFPDNQPAMREAVLRAFATGEAASTDLYLAGAAGAERVHLDFIAPLRTGPEAPRLAVVLRVDPNRFLFPYIQAWPVPSASAETLLFRGEGEHVLFLNELRHRSDTALKLRVPFTRGADLLAVQALQGRAKPGEPVEGRDYRDVPVLGVVKAIPTTAWFLVTKLDKAELYAQAKRDAGWIALAEVLALAVAAVALGLAHQRRELRHALARRREQDEKLRALHLLDAVAECSSDAIFAKDLEGRYVQANREMCRALGRTREEILGRHDRDLFPAEDAERLAAFDRRVIAGGQVMSVEEVLTTGGGVRTFLSTKGPLLDGRGDVVGLFGIARDITEKKFHERELRAGEARYRAVFDAVGEAISLHDAATGMVLDINGTMTDLYGYSRNEARNLGIGDLSADQPPHTREWLGGWFRRAAQGENPRFEWRIRHRDGTLVPVDMAMRRTENAGRPCILVLARRRAERPDEASGTTVASAAGAQARAGN